MSTDPVTWLREPGRGPYARRELERRFLVGAAVADGTAARLIEDVYLDGTSLRLRRVTGDGRAVHKLTQKVRVDEEDPSAVLITNTYLTADEHRLLSALPGHVVVKSRSVVAGALVVDVFRGHLEGLVLAEVEVADLTAPLALPDWVGAEVTHDDRYSGGRLAAAREREIAELLSIR